MPEPPVVVTWPVESMATFPPPLVEPKMPVLTALMVAAEFSTTSLELPAFRISPWMPSPPEVMVLVPDGLKPTAPLP